MKQTSLSCKWALTALLLFFGNILFVQEIYAQTITIGNTSSTSTATYYPITRRYAYNRCEIIYTKTEINNAGGGAGNISQISFYKNASETSGQLTAVKVYMKHTTSTSLSTGSWSTSGYTLVYNGTIDNSSAAGWRTITLTTPFAYNNVNNLEIAIDHGSQGTSTSIYPVWKCTATSLNTVRYAYGSSAPTSLSTTQTMRPNIQMLISGSSPTVNAGNDVAICSGNSTTLTATASGGSGSGYTYNWSNGATTASTTVSPASTTTYTVTVTDGNSATASDAVIVTVNSTVVPGVSIAANPSGMIEAGTSVTFTATPNNGGTPTYQWQKGGVNISGATSSTYAYTPTDGDIITCTMTSTAPCASPVTVVSNEITITIGIDCNYFAGKAGNTSLNSNNNLGIGCQALTSLVSGVNNVGLGYNALYSTTGGSDNIGIGYQSLYSNTGAGSFGCKNISIGTQSLFNMTGTGQSNIGIGFQSLYSTTGNFNTAIGSGAGYKITTGTYNTFIGNGAGNNKNQKVDATNSMALGNGAYTTESNQYVYGNTSVEYHIFRTGNVAIGTAGTTTLPVAKLDIFNDGNDAAIIVRNGSADADVQFLVKESGYVVARDILVKTGDIFPDYVFEKNYDLKSLSEVEKYIKENKHLPEVPSARDIKNNGLNLVDMDATLLKKIEEQTLYIIDLQKQIIEMQQQNTKMQKEIDDLKK